MSTPVDARVLTLPASLDATAAAEVLAAFRDARGSPVEVHADAVRKLGGQGAQVLLAAAAAWREDETPFEIVEASPEFAEALRLLGQSVDALVSGASA